MPQMMPLYWFWTIIFMFTLLLIMNSLIYFLNISIFESSTNYKKIMFMNWNWMW